jgi:2-(1,2-epoxy-1,2-dihydrophenyl)acetyl-CoA isomerase
MSDEPVITAVDGAVATVTLNRPRQLNVMDLAMGDALAETMRRLAEDNGVRAVVLAGAGRGFMAGGDLTRFHADPDHAPQTAAQLIGRFHETILTMAAMPKPVIAALHGPVAGGGLSLALACDLAIAAEDATFLSAYTKIATTPDGGGSWSLTRLVGPRKALELMLLNEPIDARTALSLGLVNRVVPTGTALEAAQAMARAIAIGARGAVAGAKRLARLAVTGSLADHLDAEKASFVERAGTADFREGIAAFLERRPARFES